jgi:phage terminase small subunit
MPKLVNARHELFAQALAKGKCQTEAYVEAGYQESRSAAARLAADVNICARVADIQGRAAERTEITVADITTRLLAIATKAEKSSEAPMLQAARASLMDAAKLNGLVIDRADTNNFGALTVTYVNTPPGKPPVPSDEDYETQG